MMMDDDPKSFWNTILFDIFISLCGDALTGKDYHYHVHGVYMILGSINPQMGSIGTVLSLR